MKMRVWQSVACVLWVCAHLCLASALSLQNIEENCILSFVVPKDKIKSSCELDEKVNRRINAMEMKVNIYERQVRELQIQLDKQRQLNADKMDKLDRQIKDSSVNADMSFLIERRLTLLEKEFEQLTSEVNSVKTAGGKMKTPPTEEKPSLPVFNAIDNNPVTLPTLVKSMVQSEMKGLFENFTKRFETYVQEQILLYNQVFNMLPKRNDAPSYGRSSRPSTPTSPSSSSGRKDSSTLNDHKPLLDDGLRQEFEKVKTKLDDTGHQIAKHVGSYIKNITSELEMNVTETSQEFKTTTVSYEELTLVNSSELVLTDDLFESNDSFSGENPDGNDTSHEQQTGSVDSDISSSATSRISQKSEVDANSNSTQSQSTDGQNNEKNWKENMIRDQFYKQTEIEERLKDEITSMLYSPLAEVMSLVEKQTSALEDQIKQQDDRHQQVTKDLTSHVKELDHSVQAINLQLESLSQGFQDSFVKLDKLKPLEILVNEIKKNLTAEPLSASVLEMDEQSKKLKKLERLVGVYQQSLEHYRNETKHEYRDIRDTLEKETTTVRMLAKSLQDNVTVTVYSQIDRLNETVKDKFKEINDQIRIHEDNVVLMQIDLATFERKLNSKSSRSDKDLEGMQDAMDQLANRQRDLRKKLEQVEQLQVTLNENMNLTVKDVFDLKTEVKLSVLDEWLPLTFEYDSSRTDCYGEQFVRRSKYQTGRLVGVVLCSPTRYKIFLSNSLQSTFLNIGDGNGLGEDHCEFVGGTNESHVTLSKFKPSFGAVQGYARSAWGQEPVLSYLNSIKPSPHWYECGVTIP